MTICTSVIKKQVTIRSGMFLKLVFAFVTTHTLIKGVKCVNVVVTDAVV